MRRIYESEALRRDDDDPFSPNESDTADGSHVNWTNVSHALFPSSLRARAIAVDVETDKSRYAPDEPVRFQATFRNRLPLPVSLVTETPLRWTWTVDGLPEASEVYEPPEPKRTRFDFARSERKRFHRRWPQRIREREDEWRAADPGEHTITVRIGAVDGADHLVAEETFTVER
ncbi:hypothetical protein [Halobaculum gomorrense]|uniref:DUF7974 domain-containing protein n=1 Tax=Halobaculum gomorrense TaxID=43928 RepID=A0A1M5M597_9EURY|nr:hypothetical protein [Halobaculum gomorrense]SHG72410.1 hypothetical protein SAMN05443636_0888 [Halobaculum gomorrense]